MPAGGISSCDGNTGWKPSITYLYRRTRSLIVEFIFEFFLNQLFHLINDLLLVANQVPEDAEGLVKLDELPHFLQDGVELGQNAGRLLHRLVQNGLGGAEAFGV